MSKTGLNLHASSFPSDCSKMVPLLQFIFVCASVILNVAFMLFLFVHLSFFCLGKAVLSSCGISWVSLLIFMQKKIIQPLKGSFKSVVDNSIKYF